MSSVTLIVSRFCLSVKRCAVKCYKLTEFSCQTQAKRENKAQKIHLKATLDQNRASHQKFGHDPYAILPLKGSDEFQDIRQQIFRCRDGKSILKLLKRDSRILEQSVYTSAMTKCGELGDIKNACKVMKRMHKKDIPRDRNCYNILFRALSLNEKVYEYPKYINWMVQKDNILPDIITATTLIGGCKKRGDEETAENVWNDIIIKFNLTPTDITYVQMISVYAKSANKEKAQKSFKQMMDNGIRPNSETCGALMQCFAACMDIDNIFKIKNFMELKGLKLDSFHYISLITVFLKSHLPSKALSMYHEYEQTLKDSDIPSKTMLGCKNAIFLAFLEQNIKKNIDDANTGYYYQMVTKDTLNDIKKLYGSKTSLLGKLSQNVLKAVVMYHYNLKGDEKKAMELFGALCEELDIGYWKRCNQTNNWMIDFHSFSYETCKFVLEYVFKYEQQNILDMGDDMMILCGRGYHRDKYVDDKQPTKRGLMYFVQHELAKWSPVPIRSQRCQRNYALLQLCKEDVLAYFEAQNA